MKKFVVSYWKSVIVVCCILYLSFAPSSTFDGIPTFENEDKLVHLLMYAGLATMLIFEFRLAKKENIVKSPKGFIVCFVLPLLLGGIIEILQPLYFAPRTGSWMDFSFNFFGVILAWVFMRQFGKLVNRIFVWRKSR